MPGEYKNIVSSKFCIEILKNMNKLTHSWTHTIIKLIHGVFTYVVLSLFIEKKYKIIMITVQKRVW